MKKKLFFGMAVILITAMTFGASLALAQTPPGPATSWPFLRNPTGTNATATIDFYDLSTGNKVFTVNNFSVPANSTVLVPVYSYNQAPPNGLGSSFTGSMVVSSDVPLIAMCNVVATDASGGSYSGASSGATSVVMPAIHKNNAGWYAEISVQNVDSTDATVQVAFAPTPSLGLGTAHTTSAVTIKPGAVKRWNTATISQIGTQFVGSAVATATNGKNIISAVEEWNTGSAHMTLLYNGIPSGGGGTDLYLAAQHNNNSGWNAYNYIFNPTGTNASINWEFVGTGGTSGTATVPANDMLPLFTYEKLGSTNYVGALKVHCNTAGVSLMAICNEVNSNGKQAGAYNGEAAGATTLFFPAQHNANSGWYAYNFIYNPSTTTTANVTVTWSKTDGTGTVPAPFNATVPANGRLGLYTYEHITGNVYGSLKVECTNGLPLVGVCNEICSTSPNVDAFISYNGFGQ